MGNTSSNHQFSGDMLVFRSVTDLASCSQEKSMVNGTTDPKPAPSHSRKNVTLNPFNKYCNPIVTLVIGEDKSRKGIPFCSSGNRRFEETLNQYQQMHRKLGVSIGSCHLHIKQQHVKTTWKSLEKCKITNLDISWHFFRIQNPINNHFHCHEMELFPTYIFNDTSSMWQSYQIP